MWGRSCRVEQSSLPAAPSAAPGKLHLQTDKATVSVTDNLLAVCLSWLIMEDRCLWYLCVQFCHLQVELVQVFVHKCDQSLEKVQIALKQQKVNNSRVFYQQVKGLGFKPVRVHVTLAFLTTLSLSGAWSNRVSKASRSVEGDERQKCSLHVIHVQRPFHQVGNSKKKWGKNKSGIFTERWHWSNPEMLKDNSKELTMSARKGPSKRRGDKCKRTRLTVGRLIKTELWSVSLNNQNTVHRYNQPKGPC